MNVPHLSLSFRRTSVLLMSLLELVKQFVKLFLVSVYSVVSGTLIQALESVLSLFQIQSLHLVLGHLLNS
jgi:hypothetical protein